MCRKIMNRFALLLLLTAAVALMTAGCGKKNGSCRDRTVHGGKRRYLPGRKTKVRKTRG
ncbi:MAG: hypothetical protein ACLTOJ_20695 [[Clostridium] symbiosum]